MSGSKQLKGEIYGAHRVIEPVGSLPQGAIKLDNDFSKVYDNEIVCDVATLNIDAASFEDIKDYACDDPKIVGSTMMEIVKSYGKHQNPRTGSGGMFIGKVKTIGEKLKGKIDLQEGDPIVSLVSLTLTPLKINKILNINLKTGQVVIQGAAVLFESGVWIKAPSDMPPALALAALDVAGAPPQIDRLVKPGDTVAIIGARGKSGLLCCYQAKKRAGANGNVIAIVHSEKGMEEVKQAPFVDTVVVGEADKALDLLSKIKIATKGELCDVVISCVSRSNCEMGAILIAKKRGKVYFFSMATQFGKAALGAEGVGKDIEMIIGNGYCEGHAEFTLDIIRESEYIRELFTKRYC